MAELYAELAEIDENLIRNDLTELQQGLQHARRKAIYEKLHPEAKRGALGGKGINADILTDKLSVRNESYAADAANAVGETEENAVIKISVDTIVSAIKQPQPINAAGVIAALRLAGIHVIGKTACLPDDPATVITPEFAQSAHEESVAAIRAFVRSEKAKNGGRIFSLDGVRMTRTS